MMTIQEPQELTERININKIMAAVVRAFHFALTTRKRKHLPALAGIAIELEEMLRYGYSEMSPQDLYDLVAEWAETYSADSVELFRAIAASGDTDVNEIASEIARRVGFAAPPKMARRRHSKSPSTSRKAIPIIMLSISPRNAAKRFILLRCAVRAPITGAPRSAMCPTGRR